LLQDKNARLRDENTALKTTVHEQQDTIRKIYTKLARIEEDVKRGKDPSKILATVDIPGEYNNENHPAGRGRKGKAPPDRDAEELIVHLKKENSILKKKARQLEEKCKDLAVRKTAQRRRPTQVRKPPTSRNSPERGRPDSVEDQNRFDDNVLDSALQSFSEVSRTNHQAKQMQQLIEALKGRLRQSELHNEKLRDDMTLVEKERDAIAEGQNLGVHKKDDREGGHNKPQIEEDLITLNRDLRDKNAKLMLLQTRYEHLQDKAAAEREIQERTVEKMEDYNRTIRELRKNQQELMMEKDRLAIVASKADEMDTEYSKLREANRRLEEKMTSLCESPFIRSAHNAEESIEKITRLEKLDRQQKLQVAGTATGTTITGTTITITTTTTTTTLIVTATTISNHHHHHRNHHRDHHHHITTTTTTTTLIVTVTTHHHHCNHRSSDPAPTGNDRAAPRANRGNAGPAHAAAGGKRRVSGREQPAADDERCPRARG
jgi:hypothetical protein